MKKEKITIFIKEEQRTELDKMQIEIRKRSIARGDRISVSIAELIRHSVDLMLDTYTDETIEDYVNNGIEKTTMKRGAK